MAGDAIVGALRAILGLDTAQYEDGLKKAGKQAQTFGDRIGTIATGIGLERGIEKFAEFVVSSFEKAIESADKLNKASQKIGIPVEQLSALGHVADLADVSIEALTSSFGKLSKNMLSVGGDATNITAAAFNALGINVKNANGQLKSSQDLFDAIATKFSNMQDGASKTALAIAIFGRAGAEMIPLLNLGADGIKKMADEFRKMGVVLDKDTAQSAEDFNDTLKRLGKTKDAIVLKITAAMLPAFEKLAEDFLHTANETEDLRNAGEGLGKTLLNLATWAGITAQSISILVSPITSLFQALGKALAGDFKGAVEALIPSVDGLGLKFLRLGASIRDALAPADVMQEAYNTIADALEALDKVTVKALSRGPVFSEKQLQLNKSFSDTLTKIGLDTRVVNQEFINLAPGLIQAGEHFKDLDGFGKNFATTVSGLTDKQRALNTALFALNAAKITQEFLSPYDRWLQKMKDLDAQQKNNAVSAETYQKASTKAAVDAAVAYGEAAQITVSGWSQAFKTLAEKNKDFVILAKAGAIAEATINTFLAATKALTLGPILGPIAAAGLTAAGLALVAKIIATPTGFASGGSFKVGGSGGIDSQPVHFMATPGEMVDVRRPEQQRGGTEITVRGMGPDEIFTGRWLRGLVDALNAGDRDGYRLKFAER